MKQIWLAIAAVLIPAFIIYSQQNTHFIDNHDVLKLQAKSTTIKQVQLSPAVNPNKKSPSLKDNVNVISKDKLTRLAEIPQPTQLQESVIADEKNFRKYPDYNAPIGSEQQDPVLQQYQVHERTTLNEDKSVGLTIWADKKFYLRGETVHIYAYLQNERGEKITGKFTARLINEKNNIMHEQGFSSGNQADYQTQLDLSQFNSNNMPSGIYKVLVKSDNTNIKDALTFTLTQPDIELTGEYKESINQQGQLAFDVQVFVNSTNHYYMQASLYSDTQVPIGVSQVSTALTAGLHWLTIEYAGNLIQDAKENGPFVLKNVSLAKVTMPIMRTPLLQPNFVTASYQLDEF